MDAGEIVITDDVHGGAAHHGADRGTQPCTLLPLLEQGIVPVVTGFVGSTVSGVPSTQTRRLGLFGRHRGSGAGCGRDQIWTDVNGVLTADPRIVANARSLNELSYEEVAELAYYGAKVLHPKTVTPAIEKQIPLRVLNTFAPEHPGTRIVARTDVAGGGTVKAITAIRNMHLITVAGRGMMGVPGIAARTFGSVARVGANVLMISQSSSEQSICFVVPQSSADDVISALREEFERELDRHYIDEISGHANVVIVAVVGSGMRGTPGLAAGIFNAVGAHKINVIAIAQGSSEANVSLVIDDADTAKAVQSIHDTFELYKPSHERGKR
ncbi:MAG: aspartate kinase [Caldilineaceae bacterium]